MNSEVLRELQSIEDGSVEVDAAVLQRIEIDGLHPALIVKPSSAEVAAQVLKIASARRLKVAIQGGGTRAALGNPLAGFDILLSTERLNSIFEYSQPDLMVGVQAGMKLADLQAELETNGQFLPVEAPTTSRGATVGGAIATNSSGALRLGYGPARDWLIGIKFALADGTLAKGGGRVVKNVAGFDMMKLFIGSLGTICLIHEMNFKLMPLPPAFATLVAGFDSYRAACDAALRTIDAGVFPHALTVLNARAARSLNLPEATATLLIEVRNTALAVERQVRDANAICKQFGASAIEAAGDRPAQKKLWDAVNEIGYQDTHEQSFVLKVSTLPDQSAALLETAAKRAETGEIELTVASHAGHGLTWLSGAYTGEGRALEFITEIMRQAEAGGGSVAAERVNLSLKQGLPDVWGTALSDGELKMMRRLKAELDPHGTLNPGRFVGKI
jgi:glycolate oxidase FAD binding subunit